MYTFVGDSRRYNKQHVEQIIPFLRTVGYQRKPTTLAVADHSLTTSAWAWVLAVLNTLSMCAISVKSLEPAGTDVLKCLQSIANGFLNRKKKLFRPSYVFYIVLWDDDAHYPSTHAAHLLFGQRLIINVIIIWNHKNNNSSSQNASRIFLHRILPSVRVMVICNCIVESYSHSYLQLLLYNYICTFVH